jgi:hypothetical protein
MVNKNLPDGLSGPEFCDNFCYTRSAKGKAWYASNNRRNLGPV